VTADEARRVLGLGPDDRDPDDLRRAYRRAVRRHHPDQPDGDAVRFRESVLAFELLTVTPDETVAPIGAASNPPSSTPAPPSEPTDRLDLLMVGLDRVGEVTYLDRALMLVEGVLPHADGALQVLITGGTDGNARVVDVIRLDGGDAPSPGEIHRLLSDAGGQTSTPGV
jgi:hypothetical protein